MVELKPPARSADGMLELVTTHLEMRQPPRHARVSMTGRTVALVHAQNPPVHFYRYLYDTVGSPYLWWERRELVDEALASILQDDQVELHVFQVDGVPAGFAELDRRREGEVELVHFGLVPDFIGQGLGLPFLGRVLELAWEGDDVERVTVHACSTDHPRALLVYQRLGFVVFDEVRETVQDPRVRGLFPEYEEDASVVPSANVQPPPGSDGRPPR